MATQGRSDAVQAVTLEGLRVVFMDDRTDTALQLELERRLKVKLKWVAGTSAASRRGMAVVESIKNGGVDVVLVCNEFGGHDTIAQVFKAAKQRGVLAVPVRTGKPNQVQIALARYAEQVDEVKRAVAARREAVGRTGQRTLPPGQRRPRSEAGQSLTHRPFADVVPLPERDRADAAERETWAPDPSPKAEVVQASPRRRGRWSSEYDTIVLDEYEHRRSKFDGWAQRAADRIEADRGVVFTTQQVSRRAWVLRNELVGSRKREKGRRAGHRWTAEQLAVARQVRDALGGRHGWAQHAVRR